MDIFGRTTIAFACATACATLSAPANATVTYRNSGNFSIQTAVNDNIFIDHDQAVVTVELNGVVRGIDAQNPEFRGAAARVPRGTLNLTGNARVVAGLNQRAIEMTGYRSDVRIGGNSAVDGDIESDSALIWEDEATATQRLYLQETGLVNGNITFSGYLRLQGKAVVAGDIRTVMNGSLRIDITGGFVSGSVGLGGLDYHVFNMSAGTISGSVGGLPSYVELDLSGGYIRQGLRSLGAYDGTIRGGYIDGGVAISNNVNGGSRLSVRGGRFETVASDWLFALTEDYSDNVASTLKICGGQFGYSEEGSGLLIDGKTDLHVYGLNLAYNNGRLQGTLQDGSTIDVALTFGSSWTGAFTLNTVATPSKPSC